MKARDARPEVGERQRLLLTSLAGLVPAMQRHALALDGCGDFPAEDVALLRDLGALAAPVPVALGGLGLGTEPEGALALLQALRLVGRGSLSVGRILEGHVNVLHLLVRFGSDAQVRAACADAGAGHLFGLWVTDAPEAPVRLDADGVLHGAKTPCSAAGHATRALVTARTTAGELRMLLVSLEPGERADLSGWDAHGMRATGSGRVTLEELRIAPDALVGGDGDYLCQPDFSAGAWRTSAVTLGGLEALIACARAQLIARARQDDPHQQARIGEALIAQETAYLWTRRAARIAEAGDAAAEDVANYVNLARLAVEAACLDALRLIQRSLGLTAFRRGTLPELLLRDLAFYLRQPAPDATLAEAAGHFMQRELPEPAARPW